MNTYQRHLNDLAPLTNRPPLLILIELVDAIKRGEKSDAFAMLERYAPNAQHREIIQRHMR